MLAFRILYEDEKIVAVDKPAGFHSHPPEDKSIRLSPRWNGLGILQSQLGMKLYPAHRLDRATSGVFLLSKNSAHSHALQRQFQERSAAKTYYALVRGNFLGRARLDSPLKREDGESEEAITIAEAVGSFTLPIPGPDQADRRFTIVAAHPETGRYHQIRRHLAQLGFPILGDRRHGDRKLNRAFAAETGIERLLLRCLELKIKHPVTGEELALRAPWHRDWHGLFDRAGICPL